MPIQSLLDPITIVQLGNLEIRARRILEGLYSGRHLNRSRGTSKEFSEHRPYHVGDDPRSLDWKVFGRTDRLVTKQYEEETSLSCTIVVDDSSSMGFSWDGRVTKLEYAKTMAAALAYLLVTQNDHAGLVTSHRVLPPRGSRGVLEQVCGELETLKPAGTWDIGGLSSTVGSALKRRGLLVVLSDLMHDPARTVSTLRTLQSLRYEVLVFQILDPAEIDLPFDGPIIFDDMEGAGTLLTQPDAIRVQYQALVHKQFESFKQVFQSAGIDYNWYTTDTPFDKGLGRYLSWRGART